MHARTLRQGERRKPLASLTSRPVSVPMRGLRATPPALLGPLIAGIGIAAVAYGTRLLLQAASNPRFREAMRGSSGDDKGEQPGDKPGGEPSRGSRAGSSAAADRHRAAPRGAASYFTTDAMGVDLGEGCKDWSGACVAIHEGEAPRVVENERGQRVTPAVIAFVESGEALLGAPAKQLRFSSRATTVSGHSLLLGLDFASPTGIALRARIQEAADRAGPVGGGPPFQLRPDSDGSAAVAVHGVLHSPAELCGRTLAALKSDAERVSGKTVTMAVAGVPSSSSPGYPAALRAAAARAGLRSIELLPSAAACALAAAAEFPTPMADAHTLAVIELRGLSSSLTLLDRIPQGGTPPPDQIPEGEGDSCGWRMRGSRVQLGVGTDALDTALVRFLVDGFQKEHGIDLATDHLALVRLHEAAEAAKAELCSSLSAPVSLPFITADASGPKHLDVSLSRSKYSQIIEPVISALLDDLPAALADANLTKAQLDQVLLVGGAARIAAVADAVAVALGRPALRPSRPEEATAVGAAIHARRLQESEYGGARAFNAA